MTANTPDNCYLDKGHDAHDLLGPGESCKACGFMMMPPTPPEPTPQDYDEARADAKWPTNGVAKAIARARHAGEVAERERCASVCETHVWRRPVEWWLESTKQFVASVAARECAVFFS